MLLVIPIRANGGKGRGGGDLHVPKNQYIVHRCPMNITQPGKSQWGPQGSKNATRARGLTKGQTELQITTHQSKENQSGVQRVYLSNIRVV